jgi:hypothetical protein
MCVHFIRSGYWFRSWSTDSSLIELMIVETLGQAGAAASVCPRAWPVSASLLISLVLFWSMFGMFFFVSRWIDCGNSKTVHGDHHENISTPYSSRYGMLVALFPHRHNIHTFFRAHIFIVRPASREIPKFKLPSKGIEADTAYQLIHDVRILQTIHPIASSYSRLIKLITCFNKN